MRRRQPQVERVTLHDVAAAAGVSPATAARALGGYGSVSEEARAQVLAASARLRYRPNKLARSMITGTTQTIGVVVGDIELSFFARAVRGMADEAKLGGFELILANSDEDVEKERAAIGVLLEKQVDGLILAAATTRDVAHLEDISERGVPLVLFDRIVAGVDCDAVVVDNFRAAQNATRHLIRLGHRRIAIMVEEATALAPEDLPVGNPGPVGAMTSVLREIGWADALRGAGLKVSSDLIRRCAYDREAARAETAAALRLADPPTAILATDETMSIGVLEALTDAGMRIPEEISVVAFDDAAWTTLVRPPLTVVAQPVYELGQAASRRLLARIAGDEGPPHVEMRDTTFLVRGSTGRPLGAVTGSGH
jgi:LacI family transcriptional regulator